MKPDTRHTRAYASNSYDYDYNSTITVLVGREEQQFTVHKDTICAKSKFFRAACSERWTGRKNQPIKLPEVSAADFQTYFHWVYTTKIELQSDDPDKKWHSLIDLYILGDVLDDYQLRNTSMEQLINDLPLLKKSFTRSTIRHVYERAPVGSPLRKFLVDYRIGKGSAGVLVKYPVEFLQEFVVSLFSETAVTYASQTECARSFRSRFQPETGDA